MWRAGAGLMGRVAGRWRGTRPRAPKAANAGSRRTGVLLGWWDECSTDGLARSQITRPGNSELFLVPVTLKVELFLVTVTPKTQLFLVHVPQNRNLSSDHLVTK